MSNKKDKVPKSEKTRLSDLTPQKDTPGGKEVTTPGGVPGSIAARRGPVGLTPPGLIPPAKKHVTL